MPDDTNILETQISASVTPQADASFKQFDKMMNRLSGVAAKLDKSLGRVYAGSERLVKAVDRNTKAFDRVDKSLARTNKETEKQSQSNEELASTTEKVSRVVDKATRMVDENTRAKERNSKAADRQRKEEERLSKYLERRRPKSFQDRMNSFSDRASSFGTRAGVAAGVAGAGMGMAWDRAMEFDRAVSGIGITAGSSAEDVKRMKNELMELSRWEKTNQSTDALTEAYGVLVAANVDAADALNKMLPSIGKTATAAQAAPADLSKTSLAFNQNLGIAPKDLDKALAFAHMGGKLGGFELKGMAQYMPITAANAAGIGMTGLDAVPRIISMLQELKIAGGDDAKGAMLAENFFAKLNQKEVNDAFMKMGGGSISDIVKRANSQGADPILAVVDALFNTLGNDAKKWSTVFGDLQARQASQFLATNRKRYAEREAKIKEDGGNAALKQRDKDFADATASAYAQFDRLKNSLDRIVKVVGTTFGPAMGVVAGVVERGADALQWFTSTFPGLSNVLGGGAVAVVGLTAAAAGIATVAGFVAKTLGGVSRAMLLLTSRGRRFLAVTEYRGGLSGRGTYMTGYGRGGIGRRGSRLGRGMRGLGMGGSLLGGLAEMLGGGEVGDVLDAVDMARDAREADMIRRGRRSRTIGGRMSRLWGAARGMGGRALSLGRAGFGIARAGVGAAAAGLGGTVAGAGAATVGGVVAAGAGLGYAIAQVIQKVTEGITGKDLSTHIAERWTKSIRVAADLANKKAQSLHELNPGQFLNKGMGAEAQAGRQSALDAWKAELVRVQTDIRTKGATTERLIEQKLAESSIRSLERQMAGNFDPANKNASFRGASAARGGAAPTVQDHSSITIVIEGGPNMTTNEMAQATAKALADAAKRHRDSENRLVRGAYHDGVAAKG